jgi:uncharacterized protein (UPF0548 family)
MFLLRRPEAARLDDILQSARQWPLSYDPPGIARGVAPARYRVAEERGIVGHGRDAFDRGVRALEQWRQFDLGWATLYPRDALLTPGTNVLVVARHLGFWSVNACRIVYLLGANAERGLSPGQGTVPSAGGHTLAPQRRPFASDLGVEVAGFAYGTLTEHAESGEEIFELTHDAATGAVTYRIRAVSRERAVLARLGFPVARAFQQRFRRDSLAAMRRVLR